MNNIKNMSLSVYDKNYKIHRFSSYNSLLDSTIKDNNTKKIYILDDEVSGISGLELAVKIRKYDWDSIIILVIDFDKYLSDVFNTKLMTLDIIFRDTIYGKRLTDDIKLAISIITKQYVFTFRYNHVIYRIPYNQICYIEKEPMIKRCIIHTMEEDYYISENINSILSHLNNNFCRTHQSCIVNISNIRMVDLSSNMITFSNGIQTDMLNVKMKKEIRKYVDVS